MEERKKQVLNAIIKDYIANAEPGGSRAVAKKYDLGVYPATIRNEMSDLEEEGYIEVANFEDCTGVSMMDGCFARDEICETRHEDVQKFVNVLVKAMDALQDYDTRFAFSMEKFTENGTVYTDDLLDKEIADRDYYGTELTTQEGYVFGEAWGAIADFLVRSEKIAAENAPNVAASLDPSYLSEAVGTTITAYQE